MTEDRCSACRGQQSIISGSSTGCLWAHSRSWGPGEWQELAQWPLKSPPGAQRPAVRLLPLHLLQVCQPLLCGRAGDPSGQGGHPWRREVTPAPSALSSPTPWCGWWEMAEHLPFSSCFLGANKSPPLWQKHTGRSAGLTERRVPHDFLELSGPVGLQTIHFQAMSEVSQIAV